MAIPLFFGSGGPRGGVFPTPELDGGHQNAWIPTWKQSSLSAAGIPSRHGMQEPQIFLQLQALNGSNGKSPRDRLSRPEQADKQFLGNERSKEGMGELILEKQAPKKPWKSQGRAH